MFFKINHATGHKTGLSTLKRTEIVQFFSAQWNEMGSQKGENLENSHVRRIKQHIHK